MAADISRNVVAILLVLTIAVAALGTWAVLNQEPAPQTPSSTGGEVSLDIYQPPTGQVSLQIIKPTEQELQ